MSVFQAPFLHPLLSPPSCSFFCSSSFLHSPPPSPPSPQVVISGRLAAAGVIRAPCQLLWQVFLWVFLTTHLPRRSAHPHGPPGTLRLSLPPSGCYDPQHCLLPIYCNRSLLYFLPFLVFFSKLLKYNRSLFLPLVNSPRYPFSIYTQRPVSLLFSEHTVNRFLILYRLSPYSERPPFFPPPCLLVYSTSSCFSFN